MMCLVSCLKVQQLCMLGELLNHSRDWIRYFIESLVPMGLKLILISFLSSLIMNITVLLGAETIFVWLKRTAHNPWIQHYRHAILVVVGTAFVLLIHLEAWSNTNVSQNLVGLHWTFFNVELLVAFDLLLMVASKWQLLSTMLLSLGWFKVVFVHFNRLSLGLMGLLLVLEVAMWYCRRPIRQHIWFRWPLFYGMAAVTFTMTHLSHGDQTIGAWVRQWLALVILRTITDLYLELLRRQVKRAQLTKLSAEQDALTGVLNFGTFNHALQAKFQQYQATQQAYALYALDIDRFKRVNDTYGHVAGNEVLQQVAKALAVAMQQTAHTMTLYRTGGEEFVIIADCLASQPDFKQVLQTIQTATRQLTFSFSADLIITLSLGESEVFATDLNYLEVYKRADQSLYDSKHSGRDLITVQGALL